jgi:hypothetical protein
MLEGRRSVLFNPVSLNDMEHIHALPSTPLGIIGALWRPGETINGGQALHSMIRHCSVCQQPTYVTNKGAVRAECRVFYMKGTISVELPSYEETGEREGLPNQESKHQEWRKLRVGKQILCDWILATEWR